jgi:hypothetical protein
MRRIVPLLFCSSLLACGGDSTPLPPIAFGPQWMPLMLDTTGNFMLRRMALFVDTVHVTTNAQGYRETRQKLQVDMKIGDLSTTMQMRAEIDCAGNRFRIAGMDSISAAIKGVPMPDSAAKTAMEQQPNKAVTDTNWKSVDTADVQNSVMLRTVCAKAATTG